MKLWGFSLGIVVGESMKHRGRKLSTPFCNQLRSTSLRGGWFSLNEMAVQSIRDTPITT